ncbi:MAG TPA: hypothetical protein VMV62_01460 [Candidatus Paceibacterota bacterium]|nr:hypothetical protein [Candidatus Paceibacterota bacterium]
MKSNTTVVVILTLLIAAGAYWYFFMGSSNQPPLTSSVPVQNAAQTRFQTLVSELQPISFNTAIFSDPKFTSLVDLATPVSPEPTGRLDPFAPVPGVTGM